MISRSPIPKVRKYFVAPKEAVKVYPDGREVCADTAAGKREYFNRIRIMSARQNELCAICREFMIEPTFEHQEGRGHGGGHRDDRTQIDGKWFNAALCVKCQSKGSKRYQWVGRRFVPVSKEAAA